MVISMVPVMPVRGQRMAVLAMAVEVHGVAYQMAMAVVVVAAV